MSKLKELIDRLCPNGVEYKPLGEVGTFIRGNGLQKKDFVESGVGCIHYGQIYTYYGTSATETKSFVTEDLAKKLLQVQPGNLIIACTSENVEDVGKAVAWLGKENIVTGGHSVVFKHSLNPKYVAYFFQTENFFAQKKKYSFGAKVIDIKATDLAKIIIPVPPLEVQEEIVRILDTFSAHAAELQAELQARKEQYEYYRNLLLTFNPSACGYGTDDEQEIKNVTVWGGASYEIEWKTMGEIACLSRGKVYSKEYLRDNSGDYPVYSSQTANNGELGRISTYDINGEYLTWTTDGAYAGSVFYRNGKFNITNVCGLITVKDPNIMIKYLLQWLKIQAPKYVYKGMGNPKLMSNQMEKIPIPIPPLELQEKIVTILDRFETLVNDLTQGLPAEIAAVKEQYEYYRNKLLTFKQVI